MFYKNLSGQTVKCQVTATNGSPFTSSTSVYVYGDNGSGVLGSVGSGLSTHKGGGMHIYLPSSGETNFESVSYQFSGSGAIISSVHKDPFPALISIDDVDTSVNDALSTYDPPTYTELVSVLGSGVTVNSFSTGGKAEIRVEASGAIDDANVLCANKNYTVESVLSSVSGVNYTEE